MNDDQLRAEIARIPASLRERLAAAAFDEEMLVGWARSLRARAGAAGDRDGRNRVRGPVQAPGPGDIAEVPPAGTPESERLAAIGRGAIGRGELAFCVMAGGMATRMGGVVKALVEAFDGHTFLDLRLRENAKWCASAGSTVPLWLMTSDATNGPIGDALAKLAPGGHVSTFLQGMSLRLTAGGDLFVDAHGFPSTYATGHGDLPDALRRSGLLSGFAARGGKYVWIANLDNLGATIDPTLLGWFIERAAPLQVEVARKAKGDRGGVPVWVDEAGGQGSRARRLQVLEEFRLPIAFDPAAVRVFNTNTFLARVDALSSPVGWTWCEVEKRVGDRVAVQFERLLQDLTAAVPAAYVRVPRDGVESRFMPVKDDQELALRKEAIRAVAQARGMV